MADILDVTLANIADALATTLGAAASVKVAQSYNTLTEGIADGDTPLIQCYWQGWAMDPVTGDTDRATFQGGIRHKEYLFHVDLYASQRTQIQEDMQQVHDTVEELIVIFEEQDTKPYFGQAGIKAWSVEAERAVFDYESGSVRYPGARFLVTVHLF